MFRLYFYYLLHGGTKCLTTGYKVHVRRYLARHSCPNLLKLEIFRQILGKNSNIKFHENPSSRSPVVPCGRKDMTDGQEQT
jgi:predicted RNA-binding Zn-ribbon protein involved in translation (DUF1610 family)